MRHSVVVWRLRSFDKTPSAVRGAGTSEKSPPGIGHHSRRERRCKQEFINKTLTLLKMSYGIVC